MEMNAEKPLAVVNSKAIYDSDIDEMLAQMGQRAASLNNEQGRKVILEELIAQRLYLAEAMHNLYEREPEFKAEMARIREQMLTQYAISKTLSAVKVTDEEAKKFYAENPGEFAGEATVTASHILVDTEEKASEILAKINAGEIAFEDAAKLYSSCPSREQGGSLGEFGRGQMVPEFDKAVFEMEVGQVKGPVKTQFGYHLIRLDAKNDARPVTYEEAAEEIKQHLMGEKRQKAYQSHVNQLKILYPVERF